MASSNQFVYPMWARLGAVLTEIHNVHDSKPPHDLIRREISEKGLKALEAAFDAAWAEIEEVIGTGK